MNIRSMKFNNGVKDLEFKVICGNSLDVLKELGNQSVNCVVTSPPYFGLRMYSTGKWIGGDSGCGHYVSGDGEPGKTSAGLKQQTNKGSMRKAKQVCIHCGAIRIDNQIGQEESPIEYVEKLVEVFREVKRVLWDKGSVWLNLGDSYAHSLRQAGEKYTGALTSKSKGIIKDGYKALQQGYKEKDLMCIPHMVAMALRDDGVLDLKTMRMVERVRESLLDDFYSWEEIPENIRLLIEGYDLEWKNAHNGGWYLRSDIVWAKTNVMPESVRDRPTKSHEYIFLLAKQPKYYYDYEAVLEEATGYDGRKDTRFKGSVKYENSGQTSARVGSERWRYKNLQEKGQTPNSMHLKRLVGEEYMSPVRNKRDVWSVSTKPYKGAHFATFPVKLIEPCILAGCPDDGTVLDPFSGAGTTGVAALLNGKNYLGIELSQEYVDLSFIRIQDEMNKVGFKRVE